MTALPHHPAMSVDAYFQLERNDAETRYEYIDGYITMMAGGTLDHAAISLNVASILRSLLRGSTCRAFPSDARVRLVSQRYVYPDVTVSCDGQDSGRNDTIEHPRLVIEVLSPATEAYDRGRKFAYYRECSTIQEYVLINTEFQVIEICRREKHDLWSFQILMPGQAVELISLPGVHFAVTDVYEGVAFPGGDNSSQ